MINVRDCKIAFKKKKMSIAFRGLKYMKSLKSEGHFLITIINLSIEGFTNDLDLLKKHTKLCRVF